MVPKQCKTGLADAEHALMTLQVSAAYDCSGLLRNVLQPVLLQHLVTV